LPDVQRFDVFYTSQAQEDIAYWNHTDKRVSERIERLIADIVSHPFIGIGKPEPLRHQLTGYWSRRITGEHRLVYRVDGNTVYVAQCRFHYELDSRCGMSRGNFPHATVSGAAPCNPLSLDPPG
jgi:toxin YoeB